MRPDRLAPIGRAAECSSSASADLISDRHSLVHGGGRPDHLVAPKLRALGPMRSQSARTLRVPLRSDDRGGWHAPHLGSCLAYLLRTAAELGVPRAQAIEIIDRAGSRRHTCASLAAMKGGPLM